MMSHITIDDSRFPLLVTRFVGVVSDDEFKHYLDEMTATLHRGRRVAILDATAAGYTPARQRKMQSDWLRDNHDLLERNSLGTVFVISSAANRGVLRAILWVSPMAGPHIVVATYEEAEQWALDRLRENGQVAPRHSQRMA